MSGGAGHQKLIKKGAAQKKKDRLLDSADSLKRLLSTIDVE